MGESRELPRMGCKWIILLSPELKNEKRKGSLSLGGLEMGSHHQGGTLAQLRKK